MGPICFGAYADGFGGVDDDSLLDDEGFEDEDLLGDGDYVDDDVDESTTRTKTASIRRLG